MSLSLSHHQQHPVILLHLLTCSEDHIHFVIPNIVIVMNPATSGSSSNHAPQSPLPPGTQVPPVARSTEHGWIAELMEGMIPQMAQASNALASAMDPNNTGKYRLRTSFLLQDNPLLIFGS